MENNVQKRIPSTSLFDPILLFHQFLSTCRVHSLILVKARFVDRFFEPDVAAPEGV